MFACWSCTAIFLVDEHRDELFVLGDVGKDALERDDALEAFHTHDLGLEHLGHTPDVDAFEEVVFSERSGLVQATTPKRRQQLARVIPLSTTVGPESRKPRPRSRKAEPRRPSNAFARWRRAAKDVSPLNPDFLHAIAGLNLLDHIHAGHDLPEDGVLAIEVRLG